MKDKNISNEDELNEEFATIDLLIPKETERTNTSVLKTGRTDAFILAYTKLDKQIRRIFTNLVFRSGEISNKDVISITSKAIIYPHNFIKGFDKLCKISFAEIMAVSHEEFNNDWNKLREEDRNKMLHGQLTGKGLGSKKLEEKVKLIRKWMFLIAEKMSGKIGYNGLGNSFKDFDSSEDFSNIFARKINNRNELIELIIEMSDESTKKRNTKILKS